MLISWYVQAARASNRMVSRVYKSEYGKNDDDDDDVLFLFLC